MALFPTDEWLVALMNKLNTDEHYARIARNWEGDMAFTVEPGGPIKSPINYYLDLWHGKCRQAYKMDSNSTIKPTFTLRIPYENGVRLLKGELEPMQAMLTRKIRVEGNMAVMMRNIPTVLDFVRCCREVTDGFL